MHDAVFAPVCVALGFAGRRILPHKWWTPVLVAGLLTVILVLGWRFRCSASPAQHLDNLTVLDRNYEAGFWIALAVVWGAALLYLVGDRLLPVREDEMVDSESADDVDGQPAPVG